MTMSPCANAFVNYPNKVGLMKVYVVRMMDYLKEGETIEKLWVYLVLHGPVHL